MKRMWSTALVVVAVSAVASAQNDKSMNAPKMSGGMMPAYTGCVESINHGASFALTHVGDSQMMDHGAMMKSGADMGKADMPHAAGDMPGDHMMATAFTLTGRSNLKKYVGQKVTVTGSVSHGMSDAMPKALDMLAVSTLKVVAKSCS